MWSHSHPFGYSLLFDSLSAGQVAPLGSLSPPASLVSLPVSRSTMPFTLPAISVQSLAASSLAPITLSFVAIPGTEVGSTPPPLGSTIRAPLSTHGGMILSLAADPIPYSIVQQIQSGHFVEMRDLLADNIALLNQLSSLQGTVALPQSVVTCTRLREVLSLVSWLYCFNAYITVCTSDPLARGMLAYSRLLIREALRHGGSGWLEYDRVFRRQLAINPLLSWNTTDPGLQVTTILGQRGSSRTFCTLCHECDHTTS